MTSRSHDAARDDALARRGTSAHEAKSGELRHSEPRHASASSVGGRLPTAGGEGIEPLQRLRHRIGRWFRDVKWFSRVAPDERPYFEIVFCIQAKDMAEAEALWQAAEDGLGCVGDDDDHICPHFRFGSIHQLDEGEA